MSRLSRDTNRNIKRLGWLPIQIVKSIKFRALAFRLSDPFIRYILRFKKVSVFHPHTLKPPLAKISDDKIPSVLTFNLFNYRVSDIIRRNFQILKNDHETSAIFTDNPLICFRRNKNIRDDLVRSALRQNLPVPAGSFSSFLLHMFIPQLCHIHFRT